jgi:hypothetical protein
LLADRTLSALGRIALTCAEALRSRHLPSFFASFGKTSHLGQTSANGSPIYTSIGPDSRRTTVMQLLLSISRVYRHGGSRSTGRWVGCVDRRSEDGMAGGLNIPFYSSVTVITAVPRPSEPAVAECDKTFAVFSRRPESQATANARNPCALRERRRCSELGRNASRSAGPELRRVSPGARYSRPGNLS